MAFSQGESYILYRVLEFSSQKLLNSNSISQKKKGKSRLVLMLLLITVMIVDVIENRIFGVLSHHSSHTGAPEEQTNGKYGKQRLHVKANQIVVTVHFAQPVPSLPPPSPPHLLLFLHLRLATEKKRTCMQSYSDTYCLSCVHAAAKFTASELPDVWPPAYLLLSDSSESNQHTQEELSFMHWRQWALLCLSSVLLFRFTVD